MPKPPADTVRPRVEPTDSAPDEDTGEIKTGGAWSSKPEYILKAWRETLISAGVAAVAVVLGHLLGWHYADLSWGLFPIFFYFVHGFRNPRAMATQEVGELTLYKMLAAGAGIALASSGVDLFSVIILEISAAVVIARRHWNIQQRIFVTLRLQEAN